MDRTRCNHHESLIQQWGAENSYLVETVDGPVASVKEWGRQLSRFPDGCPATYSAHYSLYYGKIFIADTSTPGTAQAEVYREIALRLNGDK